MKRAQTQRTRVARSAQFALLGPDLCEGSDNSGLLAAIGKHVDPHF